MRRNNLYRQVVYDDVIRFGWSTIFNRRIMAAEKEDRREAIRKRLRGMRCPHVCCNCAFNGWNKTRRTYGLGCARRRIIAAKSFGEMRELLRACWGMERRKPSMWFSTGIIDVR